MRRQVWLGLVILALAGSLRFVNLNSLPIFADESIYVRWAQVMRAEASLRFLPLSDGKQPLFMWVTIPFLKLFSDPLLAARFLSGLTGLGTVAGVFVLTELLFKKRSISILAAILAALTPYLVFFNRMALADSMLTMFMLWTLILSLLSIKHDRWDMAMLAGFTFGFAWLTKSPAVFMFGLLPLGLLMSVPKFKHFGYLLTTYLIGLGMYNILRLGPEFSQIALRNKDYVFSLNQILQHPLDPFIPHLRDSATFYWYFLTPIGLTLAILGIFMGKLKSWREKFILAAWFLVPILVQSAIAKQFTARYLLFTVPYAIILIAWAANRFHKAILLLIILPTLYLDYLYLYNLAKAPLPRIERSGYLEEWTAGQGIREIAVYLQNLRGPIVVGSEGYFGTPFDGLQLYLNNYPNVRVVGVGVWIDSVSEKLTSALADNQVFLVVNSDRLHADPSKLGLKLIASYPKGVRPDGTQQKLLFFEVMPR